MFHYYKIKLWLHDLTSHFILLASNYKVLLDGIDNYYYHYLHELFIKLPLVSNFV